MALKRAVNIYHGGLHCLVNHDYMYLQFLQRYSNLYPWVEVECPHVGYHPLMLFPGIPPSLIPWGTTGLS